MKKIILLVVLSLAFVLSIFAQTNYKSTNTSSAAVADANSVKDIAEKSIDLSDLAIDEKALKNAAPSSMQQQLLTGDAINLADATILRISKTSLGRVTSGNPFIDKLIEQYSGEFNIDPLLIYAQMHQESAFRARAVSSKGASGFMQLMPDTARRFGVTNIYSPEQNIKAGIKYMRWLLDKFGGDTRLALAGYNAGEGAVMKFGNQIPPYRETQNYVFKIMNHYQELSR